MAKVLVIRKPDRTIHTAPLSNKPALQAHNNRLPANLRFKMEEMDEAEAKKLPFIDPHYVSATQAQSMLKGVQEELGEKDARIAELEAMLVKLQQQQNTNVQKPTKADELIDAINKAETEDEVNALKEGESRVTVLAAADKRLLELKAK